MEYVEKLAAFDLDDTLYMGNSHFEILNAYYNTHFFTSVFMRAFGKFFPNTRLKFFNLFYNRIPNEFRHRFLLPYRQDVIRIFNEKKRSGYKMIIVSNAPLDLLMSAARNLNVEYISAETSKKSIAIQERFVFEYLFVCTDNKTDLDIISMANEAVITCRKKDKDFFSRSLPEKNVRFCFNDK